jgi:hypothetical protein
MFLRTEQGLLPAGGGAATPIRLDTELLLAQQLLPVKYSLNSEQNRAEQGLLPAGGGAATPIRLDTELLLAQQLLPVKHTLNSEHNRAEHRAAPCQGRSCHWIQNSSSLSNSSPLNTP